MAGPGGPAVPPTLERWDVVAVAAVLLGLGLFAAVLPARRIRRAWRNRRARRQQRRAARTASPVSG